MYGVSYHLAVNLSLYNDDPTSSVHYYYDTIDAELLRFRAAVIGIPSDTEFFFQQAGSSMTGTAEVTLVFDYGRRGDVAADELLEKELQLELELELDVLVRVTFGKQMLKKLLHNLKIRYWMKPEGPGGASLAASGDRCRVKYP